MVVVCSVLYDITAAALFRKRARMGLLSFSPFRAFISFSSCLFISVVCDFLFIDFAVVVDDDDDDDDDDDATTMMTMMTMMMMMMMMMSGTSVAESSLQRIVPSEPRTDTLWRSNTSMDTPI